MFSKRDRKHVLPFLSRYRNTRESLGELEKAVETLVCDWCSNSSFRSPKLPLENTVHVFCFLNIIKTPVKYQVRFCS